MFDTLPDPATCGEVDDAAVVSAIREYTRTDGIVTYGRLAWIAELLRRREPEPDDETNWWKADWWSSAAAEVGCAMHISPRRASGQLRQAEALFHRLPRVAALLQQGTFSGRLVATIIWRTRLVHPDAITGVDSAIAAQVGEWGALSDPDVELALDALIEELDPDARLRYRDATKRLGIGFGKPDDVTGTSSLYGAVTVAHAELIDTTLQAMVKTVCKQDPRSQDELRSTAIGAYFDGHDRLECRCENPDCDAASIPSTVSKVMVHMVADEAAVAAALAQLDEIRSSLTQHVEIPLPEEPDDCYDPAEIESDWPPHAPATDTPARTPAPARPMPTETPRRGSRPAITLHCSIVPNSLLAALLRSGAGLAGLAEPRTEPEQGRYPSRGLRRYLQCRDLRCRWPGCPHPALTADLDHTLPWPAGATHPSTVKAFCRHHHLIKTFYNAWSDTQSPDGTVDLTSPTGHRYSTVPISRLLFPEWDTTTATLPPTTAKAHTGNRGLLMPKRRTTRADDRAARHRAERDANAAARARDP